MLRDYQIDLKNRIYQAWSEGARNVMGTMGTGGGKAVVICQILHESDGPAVVMAHRSFLVSQLCLTLNREQVPHGIIAPKEIIRDIIALEIETHGRSYYNARAPIRVASAHTLAARRDTSDRWFSQVRLAVVDEGHHVLNTGIWAESLAQFPNARGLFKTAHAVRADGAGLGRPTAGNPNRDGLVDALVVGPCSRDLGDRGYLCRATVRAPPSDVDISDVPVGPNGEFQQDKLREAIHKSRTLVGDIVKHYQHFAEGKLGLTFAVDIKAANETCEAYNKAGVPAVVITDKTPIAQRGALMRRFRARQLLQLVSVDVLSEGVDVPAVEVISLGRHTASWQLFCQQVGRGGRVDVADQYARHWDAYTDQQRLDIIAASAKPGFLVLDHVDNVRRHHLQRGLFDSPQTYSLNRRERRSKQSKPDVIPLRRCLNEACFQEYEAHLLECPYCGMAKPAPGRRATPEQVEGDLIELDLKALRSLENEVRRVDGAPTVSGERGRLIVSSVSKTHFMRQVGQASLRPAIALWAGWQKQTGLQDREIHRLFWHRFNVDVLTAQTLGVTDAADLESRILKQMEAANVVTR